MNVGLYSEGMAGSLQVKSRQESLRKTSSLSVIVPVFNSETILPALMERLEPVLAALCSQYEVIFVNDASRDGSWEVIEKISASRNWVWGINLMRNYGQHNALLCGIRAAQYDVIVTLDDALQHPSEEIPKVLAKLGQVFDVVYGTPEHEEHGVLRDLASLATKMALQNVMGATIARQVSAFRAFRAEVASAFSH